MAPSLEVLVRSVCPYAPMAFKAPAGRRCRVSIHPLPADVDPMGNECLVYGIRVSDLTNDIVFHKLGKKEGFILNETIDATAFRTDCVYCPLDVGVISADDPMVLEFQAMGDEDTWLSMAVCFRMVPSSRMHVFLDSNAPKKNR